MKRSGPFRRRTPLRSTGRLRGTSRSGPARVARTPADYLENRIVVAGRCKGRCEVKTPVCTGGWEETHHRLRRSQGGTHHHENLLAVCRACHTYVHHHPTESYARDWMQRSAP